MAVWMSGLPPCYRCHDTRTDSSLLPSGSLYMELSFHDADMTHLTGCWFDVRSGFPDSLRVCESHGCRYFPIPVAHIVDYKLPMDSGVAASRSRNEMNCEGKNANF